MTTLNDMIRQAIIGAESEEASVAEDIRSESSDPVEENSEIENEATKVANALRFLATRGVENLLKEASGLNSRSEMGTHHPALASNEAAIRYTKAEKAKKVSPTLKSLLNAEPFADDKLKEILTDASSKGDKNINKSASALDEVRREIALRVAEAL